MIPRHLQIAIATMLAIALAMGLYLRHLQGRVSTQPAAAQLAPVRPPISGPTEQVTLYIAYDNPGMLVARAASIPLPAGRQERAQEVLRALLASSSDKDSPHPLPAGAEVNNVFLVDAGLAVIDLNAAFADGHRSGVIVEELTIVSLVQTLTANTQGISRVKFLVEGKERETLAGHADLSCTYDVPAVQQLVQQLQATQ
jgi:sporulation and spore germination protein